MAFVQRPSARDAERKALGDAVGHAWEMGSCHWACWLVVFGPDLRGPSDGLNGLACHALKTNEVGPKAKRNGPQIGLGLGPNRNDRYK